MVLSIVWKRGGFLLGVDVEKGFLGSEIVFAGCEVVGFGYVVVILRGFTWSEELGIRVR